MVMIISTEQIQLISTRAEHIYPEECCGILLGRIDRLNKTVVEVIPTINAWVKSAIVQNLDTNNKITHTKNNRYTILPQDIFKAQKRGRDLHLDIIGFFHSHPDYPAIPSTCDRDQAWEVYSYPIISVIQGKVSTIKSWVLDHDGIFQPEELQIVLH